MIAQIKNMNTITRYITLSLACIFAVALLFTITMLFITLKVAKDEIETEYRDVQLELPEDRNISPPYSLAVLADTRQRDRFRSYGVYSPQINSLNRLAVPLGLQGRACGSDHNPHWRGYQVVEVFSGDHHFTILQRLRAIKTSGFVHFWFKKTIHNFISKKLPARGPESYQFYILQQDSGDKTAIHALSSPDPVELHNMETDLKSPGNRAKNILTTFANNQLPRQKVTLLFENPREYTNKCRYGGPVPSATLSKQFFHSVKQTLDAAGKFHVFKDITYGADSVSLTVDKNSLAYLIAISSDLGIKDILF